MGTFEPVQPRVIPLLNRPAQVDHNITCFFKQNQHSSLLWFSGSKVLVAA